MSAVSAFAAYSKANGKANGNKKNNGAAGLAKKEAEKKSRSSSNTNKNRNKKIHTIDGLVEELFDDNKQLSKSQKNQKKKLEAFLAAQLGAAGEDDDSDGQLESTCISDHSADDCSSSNSDDCMSSCEEEEDAGSSFDDSDDDSDDCTGSCSETDSDAFTGEYTLNSSLSSASSPNTSGTQDTSSVSGTPNTSGTGTSDANTTGTATSDDSPVRQSASRQKRYNSGSNSDSNDYNNNQNPPITGKQSKRRSLSPKTQAVAPRVAVKSRHSLSPTAEEVTAGSSIKAPSCPLIPKGQASAAKSCPLPPKSQQPAKYCRLPSKNQQQQQEQPGNKPAARVSQMDMKTGARLSAGSASKPAKLETLDKAGLKRKLAEYNEKPEVHRQNSIDEGKRMLCWITNPLVPEQFFGEYWEKNACLVQRKNPDYFADLISFKMIDEMLIRNHLEFTTNIDVTSYVDGVRETLNPEGRAMPPTVWGYYGEGCSIRILNPSTYLSGLRHVCSVLQEFFHCLVGANVYLTPPNSQGFAPHFDDIEAFVLQVEGRKRWRLYMPLQSSDVLARESSPNYKPEQLGEPIFDEVLKPGDMLYFPRGTVHQAITEKQQHSLHITLSVYQQQAYANLLEKLMPMVLQRAIKQNLQLRRGLPLHTWQHLGLAHGANNTKERQKLVTDIQQMVQETLTPSHEQIDAAVDQLAKRFQHEALPPIILPEEKMRTVFGSRSGTDAHGKCLCDYELTETTAVRLLRANILRLVADDGKLRVYYYVDNALEYCKYEANFMEIEPTEAAAIETLMHAYPKYITIAKLPLRSVDRRIEVATALWERGLLMTEAPFK